MPISDFTYTAYSQFLGSISENGYTFTDYHNYTKVKKPCILRHDIDYDIGQALKLATFEAEKLFKHSTYFVLLNTNFFNVFSSPVNTMLKEMLLLSHEIGLQFDETCYPDARNNSTATIQYIQKEIALLEQIIEQPIKAVSMHRPSPFTLDANLVIPGVVNSYNQTFLKEFKYLSDSRHNWREDAESIIASNGYDKLHILTHPFWYTEEKEEVKNKILRFIMKANEDRYNEMTNNFRQLDEYVELKDIQNRRKPC